jgi:hypothetical protein
MDSKKDTIPLLKEIKIYYKKEVKTGSYIAVLRVTTKNRYSVSSL